MVQVGPEADPKMEVQGNLTPHVQGGVQGNLVLQVGPVNTNHVPMTMREWLSTGSFHTGCNQSRAQQVSTDPMQSSTTRARWTFTKEGHQVLQHHPDYGTNWVSHVKKRQRSNTHFTITNMIRQPLRSVSKPHSLKSDFSRELG